MSDVRKDNGKETTKEDSKKAFKCILLLNAFVFADN